MLLFRVLSLRDLYPSCVLVNPVQFKVLRKSQNLFRQVVLFSWISDQTKDDESLPLQCFKLQQQNFCSFYGVYDIISILGFLVRVLRCVLNAPSPVTKVKAFLWLHLLSESIDNESVRLCWYTEISSEASTYRLSVFILIHCIIR